VTFLPDDFDFDACRAVLVPGCPHCHGVLLGHWKRHQAECVATDPGHDCTECARAVARCLPDDPFSSLEGTQ
jgi:hypothetical protein